MQSASDADPVNIYVDREHKLYNIRSGAKCTVLLQPIFLLTIFTLRLTKENYYTTSMRFTGGAQFKHTQTKHTISLVRQSLCKHINISICRTYVKNNTSTLRLHFPIRRNLTYKTHIYVIKYKHQHCKNTKPLRFESVFFQSAHTQIHLKTTQTLNHLNQMHRYSVQTKLCVCECA